MKDKKKIIIPVVVAVIVIIAVVIIGITTLKKKAETTKIDIDTKSYVADLSKYIEKIDDTKDVEETKESISSEIVTLQKKYPNSESVSLSSVELLNKGKEIVIIDNFSNSKPEVLDKIKKIKAIFTGVFDGLFQRKSRRVKFL